MVDRAAKEGSDTVSSQRQLHERNGKLYLTIGFNFGLATVQWEFNLSPLLASTSDRPLTTTRTESHRAKNSATDNGEDDDNHDDEDLLSLLRGNRNSNKGKQGLKRGHQLLEDDDEVDREIETGPVKGVDGMSVLFDHVVLPLISLTNVYRKQVRAQEAVIKAKENEVYEALEILELSGINHRNRRRATEPHQKGAAEAKVQSDIELLVRPQLYGPTELFGEKTIAHLCSIVTKNAVEAPGRPSVSAFLLDRDTLSNDMGQPSLTARGSGPGSADAATLQLSIDSATIPLSVSANSVDAETGDGKGRKLTKQEEEEENRRILWEKLDKERAEKARAGKKKKLF
ncbi:hypothetical protein EMPS_01138 [Entomortierella parvispora]|uniref:Uncharacterized protein n=1 Tax=Entomortierella parvispora TaxID=205924 RepID=A0A9P3H301_9FUNG|nr:hypothetical protein EMPS_01138 [Entomortierella parvispora]